LRHRPPAQHQSGAQPRARPAVVPDRTHRVSGRPGSTHSSPKRRASSPAPRPGVSEWRISASHLLLEHRRVACGLLRHCGLGVGELLVRQDSLRVQLLELPQLVRQSHEQAAAAQCFFTSGGASASTTSPPRLSAVAKRAPAPHVPVPPPHRFVRGTENPPPPAAAPAPAPGPGPEQQVQCVRLGARVREPSAPAPACPGVDCMRAWVRGAAGDTVTLKTQNTPFE
jgi:hypothetical protein